MARIRTIKPEFFRHEGLQDLESENPGKCVMLVFAGLWGHCDKAGRFEWKPRTLKLDILPFLDFNMDETLTALCRAGFIRRYEVDGKEYGEITSFEKHQRIGGKEAQEPAKHPEPTENEPGSTGEALGNQQGLQEGKGREEEEEGNGEREGKGMDRRATSRASQLPADFYPDETGTTLADSLSIPFAAELEKFRDYHKARGKPMKDWQAAWRTWARNAAQFAKERGGNRQSYLTEKQRRDDATTRAIFGSLLPATHDEKVIEHEPETSIRLG